MNELGIEILFWGCVTLQTFAVLFSRYGGLVGKLIIVDSAAVVI